jgi:hypothetical protein
MDRRVIPVRGETWHIGALVAAGCVLLAVTTNRSPSVCNDSSRLATADALLHYGTFAIDRSYFRYTCDEIRVQGRTYSDKPPLLSLYLAGVLYLIEHATGWRIPEDLPQIYYFMTLLSSGLAFLATLVGCRRLLLLSGAGSGWATMAGFCCGACTLMLPFSSVISNHAVTAALLVWAAVIVVRFSRSRSSAAGLSAPRPGRDATAPSDSQWRSTSAAAAFGLLAGLGMGVDLLASTVMIPLAIALAWRKVSRPLALRALLGSLLPLGLHAALCCGISGNPLAPSLDPSIIPNEAIRTSLAGTAWKHPSVISFATYAFHSLFGYRGFFLFNPGAILGVVGLILIGARREQLPFAAALGGGLLCFFALSLGFSNNFSGYSYGVRWHATIAPLVVAVGGGAVAFITSPRLRHLWQTAFLCLALLGGILGVIGTLHPWTTTTEKDYSFVEVFSDRPAYIRREIADAQRFLATGHWVEAGHYARLALRRSVLVPEAWRIAVLSAVQQRDPNHLRRYRRWADDARIPAQAREELVRAIDTALQDAGKR